MGRASQDSLGSSAFGMLPVSGTTPRRHRRAARSSEPSLAAAAESGSAGSQPGSPPAEPPAAAPAAAAAAPQAAPGPSHAAWPEAVQDLFPAGWQLPQQQQQQTAAASLRSGTPVLMARQARPVVAVGTAAAPASWPSQMHQLPSTEAAEAAAMAAWRQRQQARQAATAGLVSVPQLQLPSGLASQQRSPATAQMHGQHLGGAAGQAHGEHLGAAAELFLAQEEAAATGSLAGAEAMLSPGERAFVMHAPGVSGCRPNPATCLWQTRAAAVLLHWQLICCVMAWGEADGSNMPSCCMLMVCFVLIFLCSVQGYRVVRVVGTGAPAGSPSPFALRRDVPRQPSSAANPAAAGYGSAAGQLAPADPASAQWSAPAPPLPPAAVPRLAASLSWAEQQPSAGSSQQGALRLPPEAYDVAAVGATAPPTAARPAQQMDMPLRPGGPLGSSSAAPAGNWGDMQWAAYQSAAVRQVDMQLVAAGLAAAGRLGLLLPGAAQQQASPSQQAWQGLPGGQGYSSPLPAAAFGSAPQSMPDLPSEAQLLSLMADRTSE